MVPAVLAQQSRSGGNPLVDKISAAAMVLSAESAVPYAAKQRAWPKFSGLNLALGRLSPPVGAAGPVQHSG